MDGRTCQPICRSTSHATHLWCVSGVSVTSQKTTHIIFTHSTRVTAAVCWQCCHHSCWIVLTAHSCIRQNNAPSCKTLLPLARQHTWRPELQAAMLCCQTNQSAVTWTEHPQLPLRSGCLLRHYFAGNHTPCNMQWLLFVAAVAFKGPCSAVSLQAAAPAPVAAVD